MEERTGKRVAPVGQPDGQADGHLERTLDTRTSFASFGGRSGSLDPRTSQAAALLGPHRPRPHKIWRKKFIKLLIVGDSGLGKTTLLRTLLSTPGERLDVHDGSATPTSQFVRDPESLCTTVKWKDEEDRVIWVYRVQDTPGYGDAELISQHIAMMRDHIHTQNLKWLALEQALDRGQDLSEADDPRIDCCLFCLPPHRLRAMDVRYMYELGKLVPIIPIITKADTMTIREAQVYRQEVFHRLNNPGLRGSHGPIHVFKFEKDSLERAGMSEGAAASTPPFMVVASNDINDEMGAMDVPVFWPERRYPWGTAEAFCPDHGDLIFLRALLLKEALEEVAKDKRKRYEQWRREYMEAPRLGRKLRGFLLATLLPVGLALYAARHGFKLEAMRAELSSTASAAGRSIGLQRTRRQCRSGSPPPAAVQPLEPAPAPQKPAPQKRWF